MVLCWGTLGSMFASSCTFWSWVSFPCCVLIFIWNWPECSLFLNSKHSYRRNCKTAEKCVKTSVHLHLIVWTGLDVSLCLFNCFVCRYTLRKVINIWIKSNTQKMRHDWMLYAIYTDYTNAAIESILYWSISFEIGCEILFTWQMESKSAFFCE